MAGRQAKTLTKSQQNKALRHIRVSRNPERDRVMLLLSFLAGLRAGEIAKLTWPMVTRSDGLLDNVIELHNRAAKKGSGRTIPIHQELRKALLRLRRRGHPGKAVIYSERTQSMRPSSIVNWFRSLYRKIGFEGCSSHSGRRTFVTTAARVLAKTGGSLRDVQQLAGHASIEQTQAYIEGNTRAKHRLVARL